MDLAQATRYTFYGVANRHHNVMILAVAVILH